MADMIAVRQLFTYRTDSVKIAGNPVVAGDRAERAVDPPARQNSEADGEDKDSDNVECRDALFEIHRWPP